MNYVLILLFAALIPPIYLLRQVYKKDKIEKEPPKLLIKLFLLGVLSALPVLILELSAESLISSIQISTAVYIFLSSFVIPGFIEEWLKYVVLKKCTWNHPAFNYKFDAIVYAVFASLGFAAIENVMYVMNQGIGVAILRAVLSIPGHASFGVIMGYGYAKAKHYHVSGNAEKAKSLCVVSWFLAAIAHGLFDYIITINGGIYFYLYVLVLFVVSIRLVKKASANDEPINQE